MKNLNLAPLFILSLLVLISGCLRKTISDLGDSENSSKIKTIYPTIDCPVEEARPTFSWTDYKTAREDLNYRIEIVEVKDKQDARSAIENNEKLANEKDIEVSSIELPTIASDLKPNKVYAYQISAYGKTSGKIYSKSDETLFYTLDAKLPDYFQKLICCEENLIEKSVSKWQKAYGNPETNEKEAGCFTSQGTIQMKGNRIGGDGIYQILNNKIKKDNYYQISFCAKSIPKETEYVRFRFIAFNGTLPSNGSHPEITASKAVVGESGDINGDAWNRYFLSSWKAPKDYEKIAVFVVTNEHTIGGAHAIGSISNICMQITDDCGLTAGDIGFSADGTVPDDAKNYIKKGADPEAIDINYSEGKLVDLFGKPFNADGKSNWYGLEDECISVGSDVPSEAEDVLKKYLDFKLADEIPLELFGEGMNTFHEKFGNKMEFPNWEPIPKEKENNCRAEYDKSKPFNGRDVIYVHGLVLDQIIKRTIANDQTGYLKAAANGVDAMQDTNYGDAAVLDSISRSWPDNQEAFLTKGFYHNNAKSYYKNHIQHFLGDTIYPSNRYMLVAYNSSQRLIENVHAALSQIALAMNEGEGVVYGNDPRGQDCFGKDVVIISHSTGALLMDVAMAIAEISADDEAIQKAFGNVKYIADRTKVHVSLHGAIAGSELAALGVLGANMAAVAAVGTDIAVDVNIAADNAIATGHQLVMDAVTGLNTAGTTNNTDFFEAFMDEVTDSISIIAQNLATTFNNSVLVDLSPLTAKLLWGDYINKSKVPVLTVAGGHPGGLNESLVTKWILPGFDDGVVSANSQSGSPSFLHPELYLYIPPEGRIFQKGIDLRRSAPYFAEQSKGVLGAAYGSIPFLSPTGMVQPVLTFNAPSPRYNNHFPFLQSASEHMHSFDTIQVYVSTFGAPNVEECLAVENSFVFDNELVNPAIADLVTRSNLGQDLTIPFNIPYPVFNFFPPPPTLDWQNYYFEITIPIWRRTYDTLSGNNQETNFVYNFVLR